MDMAGNMALTLANRSITPNRPKTVTSGLFRRYFRPAPPEAEESLRPDELLYVIGDIHGRLDLLNTMLDRILSEAPKDAHIVFLGDYVDRGPDSALVIKALRYLQEQCSLRVTCLRGNHEAMLLGFLDAPHANAHWLWHGGRATLKSYGLPDPGHDPNPENLIEIRNRFHAALPAAEEAFLRRLPAFFQSGNVFISHAGADPYRSIDDQTEKTMLWGNPDMLTTPREDNQWVVHGHYIQDHAIVQNRRIGLDTGAFFTERLSVGRIQTGALGILVS